MRRSSGVVVRTSATPLRSITNAAATVRPDAFRGIAAFQDFGGDFGRAAHDRARLRFAEQNRDGIEIVRHAGEVDMAPHAVHRALGEWRIFGRQEKQTRPIATAGSFFLPFQGRDCVVSVTPVTNL